MAETGKKEGQGGSGTSGSKDSVAQRQQKPLFFTPIGREWGTKGVKSVLLPEGGAVSPPEGVERPAR